MHIKLLDWLQKKYMRHSIQMLDHEQRSFPLAEGESAARGQMGWGLKRRVTTKLLPPP